jgi:hypothetical protein
MAKVWSIGANLNTGRDKIGGFGTQSSAVATGGGKGLYNSACNDVEEYNGSSWENANGMPASLYLHGSIGITSAGLIFGGDGYGYSAATYSYDGTNWNTLSTVLSQARKEVRGSGTQNAALAFGGAYYSSVYITVGTTEEYNGNTWETSGSLNTVRCSTAGFGTQTATTVAGGRILTGSGSDGDGLSSVEHYNGTSWTTDGNIYTPKKQPAGTGDSTTGLVFGSLVNSDYYESHRGVTLEYNGITWSHGGLQNQPTGVFGAAGNSSAAQSLGGRYDGYMNTTEVYSVLLVNNIIIGSWSVTSDIPGTYILNGGGTGIASAALQFGGALWPFYYGGSFNHWSTCYEWDNASWSSESSLTIARGYLGGAGTVTAGLAFGGASTTSDVKTFYATTEERLTTTWSNQNPLSIARAGIGGCGTQGAALAGPGYVSNGSGGYTNTLTTEEYNGTNWGSGGNVISVRYNGALSGSQTASSLFNGVTATESYDGTTWSDIGTPLFRSGYGGCGSQNSAMSAGDFYYQGNCNKYNGTSWYVAANPLFFIDSFSMVGANNDSVLVMGGYSEYYDEDPTRIYIHAAFKYEGSNTTYLSIAGVWCVTDGYPNLRRWKFGMCGTSEFDGLIFGGMVSTWESGSFVDSLSNTTYERTGLSWTVSNPLNVISHSLTGFGTQTAGVAAGGVYSNSYVLNTSETYDGTSWTQRGNFTTDRKNMAGFGTQSAGVIAGGYTNTTDSAVVNEFNDLVWSTESSLNVAKGFLTGCGTQLAGLITGGSTGAENGTKLNVTEEYNGTIWSGGGNLNTARNQLGGCGSQTDALSFGGWTGVSNGITEAYDGTVWLNSGSMVAARYSTQGCGSGTSALAYGGYSNVYDHCYGPVCRATETYTGPYFSFKLDGWKDSSHIDLYWQAG